MVLTKEDTVRYDDHQSDDEDSSDDYDTDSPGLTESNSNEDDDSDLEESEEENKDQHSDVVKVNKPERKHILFNDDDEEDVGGLEPTSASTTDSPDNGNVHDVEESEESDSDAAPDEDSLHRDHDLAYRETIKMKQELVRLEAIKKQKRKDIQQRNKEQKATKLAKLSQLEDSRLPEDILAKVDPQRLMKRALDESEAKAKRTKFDIHDDESLTDGDIILDESIIPIEKGVKIRVLNDEIKKVKTMKEKALDFRTQRLYGDRQDRISSWDQRQMTVRQKAGGKDQFG